MSPHRNIILIGPGLHYQSQYHEVLEKRGDSILLLIDLKKSKESILHFFSDKVVKPLATLFLEERFRNTITVEDIKILTACYPNLSQADTVIICTEPKARKSYAIWAAQKGLSLFMDKPITAFLSKEKGRILKDYNEISYALQKSKVNAVVSCERRANHGHLWLKNYLFNFINKHKIPITSIDIQYAGGVFNLPSEYLWSENHPLQYGYGVLLHSGYHYIDLLTRLLSLNRLIYSEKETLSLQTMISTPFDQIQQLRKDNFSHLQGEDPSSHENLQTNSFINHGETDLFLMGETKLDKKKISHFSVKLIGTSLSLRKTNNRPINASLPGRARQEMLSIHLGHHASIHLSSMPLKKIKPDQYEIEHFDILVMNGPKIYDQEPIIKLDRVKLSELFPELPKKQSMNSYAKKWQLTEFLEGRDGNSSFDSHHDTVVFIDKIYTDIFSKDAIRI